MQFSRCEAFCGVVVGNSTHRNDAIRCSCITILRVVIILLQHTSNSLRKHYSTLGYSLWSLFSTVYMVNVTIDSKHHTMLTTLTGAASTSRYLEDTHAFVRNTPSWRPDLQCKVENATALRLPAISGMTQAVEFLTACDTRAGKDYHRNILLRNTSAHSVLTLATTSNVLSQIYSSSY
jgi:hypothetical protein